jgi:hypothetical protein
MKKLLLALSMLAMVGTASAQWHHHGGYYRGGCYGCGGNWVAPAIIGGVIGYELSRPPVYTNPVIVQQPPIIVQQQPQTVVQAPPAGYHWQEMIDPATNTAKIVLVPN